MKILSLFILALFCASCHQEVSKNALARGNTSDSFPGFLISKIEKFSIPFDNHVPDNNTLMFLCSKRFDTSYLVHLQKRKDETRGVLYEVLPTYHRDIDDFADKQDQRLFFEGYSFKIDSIQWNSIINATSRILKEKDARVSNEACLDCPSYILAYGSIVRNSSDGDRSLFAGFSQYLKDSLLNQFIRKRQPVLHKP